MEKPGRAGDEQSGEVLVRERHDWSETSPVVAIAVALSSLDDGWEPATGTGEYQLADYVDGDALTALLTHDSGPPSTISLTVDRYRVAISGEELVVSRAPTATG